jgi:hypothetical protein
VVVDKKQAVDNAMRLRPPRPVAPQAARSP